MKHPPRSLRSLLPKGLASRSGRPFSTDMRALRNVAALASAALAACALNPPPPLEALQREAMPNLKAPAHWAMKAGAEASVVDGWLASFNDPTLDALVREALEYNSDLRVAAARVEIAAAYV